MLIFCRRFYADIQIAAAALLRRCHIISIDFFRRFAMPPFFFADDFHTRPVNFSPPHSLLIFFIISMLMIYYAMLFFRLFYVAFRAYAC